MSTVKEDLLAAAGQIETDGWGQNLYVNVAGEICIMQALSCAVGGGVDKDARLMLAANAVKNHLGIAGRSLATWNDRDGRTKDEVLAALRAAAEVAS